MIFCRYATTTGTDNCNFKIKNSSTDDKILLFKIRRSEPKLLDYAPKCGIIEPGVTKNVTMQLVDPKITFARVLVKLVSIDREHLKANFSDSWDIGAEQGVVKKVVDVKNLAFSKFGQRAQEDDAMSVSMASEDIGGLRSPEGALSPTEEIAGGKSAYLQRSGAKNTTNDNISRLAKSVQHIPTPNSAMSPSQEELFEVTEDLPDAINVVDVLSVSSTPVKRNAGSNSTAQNPAREISSVSSEANYNVTDEEQKRVALACSSIRTMASSSGALSSSHDSLVVKIDGQNDQVTDRVVNQAIRLRCAEAFNSRSVVTVIDITNAAHVSSFNKALGVVFDEDKDSEVERLRAVMLEANLKHILLNGSKIRQIDNSINRFSKITSLDLSGNDLSSIPESLRLPLLQRLDLSHNKLSNLNALECLSSLKTLNFSHNLVKTLNSVNVIVTLSSSIISVNFAGNPIATDTRYAAYVISAFPKLQTFDGRNLQTIGSRANGRAGYGGGGSYTAGSPFRKTATPVGMSKSFSDAPALPGEISHSFIMPDTADAASTESKEDRDFDRRLKHALKVERPGGSHTLASQAGGSNDQDSGRDTSTGSGFKQHQPVVQRVPFSPAMSLQRPTPIPASAPSSAAHPGSANSHHRPGSANSASLTKPVPFSSHLTGHTTANRGRRMSQKEGMLQHIAAHMKREAESASGHSSPIKSAKEEALRNLTKHTALHTHRRKSFGMGDLNAMQMSFSEASATDLSGYHSDPGGRSKRLTRSARNPSSPDRKKFLQMQEDPRYSIYHPRYRLPKKTFGFSKPFVHRTLKSDKTSADVPLFDRYVQRMREGFEKLPQRGTFSRASKGLQAGWYPMDYADLEAIRRQGYFHENIGDIQKYSYRDMKHSSSVDDSHVQYGAGIHQGSVAISPRNNNRRATITRHESRQYKFESERGSPRSAEPPDSFSNHKKWYPQEFLDQAAKSQQTRSRASSAPVPVMSLNISLDSHSQASPPRHQSGKPMQSVLELKEDAEAKKLEAYLAWLETQNTAAPSKTMSSLFGTVNSD